MEQVQSVVSAGVGGGTTSTASFISSPAKNKKALPFPIKLHLMLETASNNHLGSVISWELNGQAFKVHDADKFVELCKWYISAASDFLLNLVSKQHL